MTFSTKARLLAGTIAAGLAISAGMAAATEGYVALGYSAVQRGQGGAGVAEPGFNSSAATVNPAAIAGMGQSLTFGVELFSPNRGYTANGTFFVAPGEVDSGSDIFLVPDFSYTLPLDNGTVVNFSAYGNGGMNTSYDPVANPNCGGGTGVFCGGAAGVDLSQLFIAVTWAGASGNLSWGIAPLIAAQGFKAYGLQAFSGVSVDPAHLTGTGRDYSYGVGLRAGVIYAASDAFRLGLSAQTKIDMSPFDDYAGLFENGGDFDIPAQFTVGVAWDATPEVTLMLDYQKIFYSGIGAVGNATDAGPLGAPDGAGFGWDDVDVLKLGVAWQASDRMIWRAGYAHASNPIGPEDVTINILAPGVVQDHITFGGSYLASETDSVDFALIYVPSHSVSGPEVLPTQAGPFTTPGSQIDLTMDQLSFSIGWSHRF